MRLHVTIILLLVFVSLHAQRERELLAKATVQAGWINGYDYTEETLESDTRIEIFRFKDAPEVIWLEFIWLEDGGSCIGPIAFTEVIGKIAKSEEYFDFYKVAFTWEYSDSMEEEAGTAEGFLLLVPEKAESPNLGIIAEFTEYKLEYETFFEGAIHPDLLEIINELPMAMDANNAEADSSN
ncbi:hypothetical protein [Robertkochia sediminum]|uniref:hypothetical protein n=1 Tax=Robertkochia sediminum TaxID=2785326 RepID=UPI0019335524|nr:hypothetical protein [Robertkochia sediminum]MBL7471404.1 hypothetical protein [Robertkochia sediminum]